MKTTGTQDAPAEHPALPGIDVQEGISRLAGKWEILYSLLVKFRQSQGESMQKIRQALDSGDLQTAVRLAHSIKGVAGNISAKKLHLLSRDLEAEIKQGDTEKIDQGLALVQEELARVLTGIADLELQMADSSPAGDQTVVLREGPNGPDVSPLLQELADYLAEQDSRAIICFKTLRQQAGNFVPGYDLNRLAELIDRYDFEAALQVVSELKTHLNVEQKGK